MIISGGLILPDEEHDVVVRGIHEEENQVDTYWDGAQKHHDGPNIITKHEGRQVEYLIEYNDFFLIAR